MLLFSLVSFIALVIEWLIALALAEYPVSGIALGWIRPWASTVIARACARLFH